MGQILIRQPNGTWREPDPAGYAAEADLQQILAEYPELIPGVSADAVTCREFQSTAGPADVVVVDADGQVTLVECKLASNPQIRREIVGQMFDYASRLWKMGIEDFDARWQDRTGQSPFPADDDGVRLRDFVAENLTQGRFRIVLAVDAINEPLKRMTEYLNAMSGPDTSIIAVEYARLTQGTIEMLMAQTYGKELAEAKAASAARDRTVWDTETYRAWLQDNEPASMPNFLAFINETAALGLDFEGSKAVSPSGGLKIHDAQGRRLGSVSLFHFSGQGTSVEFSLIPMSRLPGGEWPPDAGIEAFLREMESTPGLADVGRNLRASRFTTRRPNVSLASLDEESVRRGLRALRFLWGSGSVSESPGPLS
ncbi:hypothetical protein [Arthrobacter sp. zg-Y238]|uniref:hypothetical protein n=1 Tax=Arthrobacter sp. zg-Y238 TaxID=2964614 RepID=UPI002107C3D6|nr:hypothetical protein [Arthrobacter sp. zg-Y238]MCQ1954131.1 hypothetical protein [Arthrobacter sp. zg-Y238]